MRRPWLALACLAGTCGPVDDTDVVDTDTFHDPLSRPATPTLDVADAHSAATCAECHPDHAAEWGDSMHARAMTDPVFRALVYLRQSTYDGAQDAFCTQCHSAIGVRGGVVGPGFSFDGLPDVVAEGVTCDACHRVTGLARVWNSGHELDLNGPIHGPFLDAEPTSAHDSVASAELVSSEFCGACHEVIELNGLPLERPYGEWRASPAYADGLTCQGCHMPERTGPAASGGRERTLHRHQMVGVDVPLGDDVTDERRAAMADEVAGLLRDSAHVDVTPIPAGDRLDLVVTVTNDVAGHAFPTGSTFVRQVWLEVVVTDATGAELFVTGDLDANGDLRDRWSALDPYGDEDLVAFGSRFVDADGAPVLLPWQAAEHFTSAIPPLLSRTVTYFVPVPDDAVGPLTARARLRLRTHPPFLARLLGLEAALPRVQTYDVDDVGVEVPLP